MAGRAGGGSSTTDAASDPAAAGIVLHAPNVRAGGGLVLLRELLLAPRSIPLHAILDARARPLLPPVDQVSWIAPGPGGRLRAEIELARRARSAGSVLCFHNLPPLFPVRGPVDIYLQNRFVVGGHMTGHTLKTVARTQLERLLFRACLRPHHVVWVQTASMRRLVESETGHGDVRVLPFAASPDHGTAEEAGGRPARSFDFVYPASADAHKNHAVIAAAWRMLAADGLFPTLGLTLPEGAGVLAAFDGLEHVVNLGPLPHAALLSTLAASRAMLFASSSESFGLPLIEASRLDIPVIAPELDYVRDVCDPAQTFDPSSPVSLARAVRRQIGRPETPAGIATAGEFLARLASRSG